MPESSRMKLRNSHGTILLPFLLFAGSLLATPAGAEVGDTSSQARQLINAMSAAAKHLNYDGVFVYRHGNRLDTLRIIHQGDGDQERERLVSLTGFAREVIRDADSVTCYFPDDQAVMVEKSRPRKFLATQLPHPIEKIADFYDFSVTGKERVAGRAAWVVNITPRDDYRYGYQLWIDEETRLLLKSELHDDSGWPVEQILFTSITFPADIQPDLLKPALSGKGYTWYTSKVAATAIASDTSAWLVSSPPAGFVLDAMEKQQADDSALEHIVYTDGLAMVSIFIERMQAGEQSRTQPVIVGGVNTVAVYSNGYQITAMGEVPLKTVRQMASSVMWNR